MDVKLLGNLLFQYNADEAGNLVEAMARYAAFGKDYFPTGRERYVWPVLRQMVDKMKAGDLDAEQNP